MSRGAGAVYPQAGQAKRQVPQPAGRAWKGGWGAERIVLRAAKVHSSLWYVCATRLGWCRNGAAGAAPCPEDTRITEMVPIQWVRTSVPIYPTCIWNALVRVS